MDEDPAFYEKFSRLIQQAIDDYRAQRLSDLEYLHKVVDIRNSVVGRVHDDVPDSLAGNEDAMAYFGVLKPFLTSDECLMMNDELHSCPERSTHTSALVEEASADAAIAICGILEKHNKVHFWDDDDAKNLAINEIDDYLYDELKTRRGIGLSLEEMDRIIEKVMQVAEHRSKR
jgi:type I restriction enzyme R subunit